MTPRRDAPASLELFLLAPFWIGAVAAWLPNFLFSPSAAYELTEIALLFGGIFVAWRCGAAAAQDPASVPFFVTAAAAVWIAIWPAGALFLSGSDLLRYGVVILAIAYLWAKGALAPRLAFWSGMGLALIVTRTLL